MKEVRIRKPGRYTCPACGDWRLYVSISLVHAIDGRTGRVIRTTHDGPDENMLRVDPAECSECGWSGTLGECEVEP